MIERLPILILYPHNRCNCRCVMCDIWKADTVQEISVEELDRHAGDMARLKVEWVVLSGGEPLMHSDLFRFCRKLREWGIRTTLLSTGLLLERNAARIVETVDEVIVSLDGPPAVHDSIRRASGAYRMLEAGVRALHAIDPAYPVAARSTIQRANFQVLRETAATARAAGLRSISFLAVDVTSSAFARAEPWSELRQSEVALSAEQIPLLEQEASALLAEHGGFVVESAEKMRRIVDHFRVQLGQMEAYAPRCNAPWVSAVVESDGTVRPCFFHAAVGNWRTDSLVNVIHSPAALAFRGALDVASNAICRRCVCSLYREL